MDLKLELTAGIGGAPSEGMPRHIGQALARSRVAHCCPADGFTIGKRAERAGKRNHKYPHWTQPADSEHHDCPHDGPEQCHMPNLRRQSPGEINSYELQRQRRNERPKDRAKCPVVSRGDQ